MAETGREIDTLFRVLGIYLDIRGNEKWAELLGYSEPSPISRIRNGKMLLTEEKKRLLCEACGLQRRELDLPLEKLIERLQIEDDVPSDLVKLSAGFLSTDLELIRSLSGPFILLYPGRDYATGNLNVVISERISIDKETLGGRFGNIKNAAMHDNFVTNTSSIGKLTATGGVLHLAFEFPDYPFPPSTFLLEVLTQSPSVTILTGLYLDVTGEARRRIFSTQCCMFNCDKDFDLPRSMGADHPLHARWKAAMDNRILYREKLLAKSGEGAIEELSALVLATRG